METQLQQRLQELRAEYERGLREMARLDQRRQEVQRTLLRISGGIQVLDEMLATEQGAGRPEQADQTDGGALRAVGA